MDVARDILRMAADADGGLDARSASDDGHDMQAVCYHIDMMADAGLVRGSVRKDWNGRYVGGHVDSLTWEGNDFLDSVSEPSAWRHVKESVARIGPSVPFEVVKDIAVTAIRGRLGV